jgi:hypothetical protein
MVRSSCYDFASGKGEQVDGVRRVATSGARNILVRPSTEMSVVLGRGFDTVTHVVRDAAIEAGPQEPDGLLTQDVQYELFGADTRRELETALGISASASFSGLVGGASTDISVSEQTRFSSIHSHLAIHVIVRNAPRILRTRDISQRALKDLRRDTRSFFEKYGDTFVDSIITGGEFLAIVTFDSLTEEAKRQLDVKIRGSAGTFEGEGELHTRFSSFSSDKTLRVEVRQSGISGAIPKPSEVEEYARNFPALVASAASHLGARPIFFGVTDYGVSTPAGTVTPYPKEALHALGSLASMLSDLDRLQSAARAALDYPQLYGNPDQAALQAISSDLQAGQTLVLDAVRVVYADPLQSRYPLPQLDLASVRGRLPRTALPVTPVYRYHFPNRGHFLTTNRGAEDLAGWQPDPAEPAFYILSKPITGSFPLKRYYNGRLHYYTTEGFELPAGNYHFESAIGYVFPDPLPGTLPLYQYGGTNVSDYYSVVKIAVPGYALRRIACYVFAKDPNL